MVCRSLRPNRGALRPCAFDPRRSPIALCGTRRINLYPAEESPPTKVPLATVRAQAPRRMGPIYYAAYCSHATNRSHIHLGSVCSLTRHIYLCCVAHLAHWMASDGHLAKQIGEPAINRFLAEHLPRCTCPHPVRRNHNHHRSALKLFLKALQKD